mmetsp:Transcript_9304/g.13994  ORF Transcript_9304/g.13994 Transcript_9304/m.13994 type:complete len:338 (+) Transcript_9304:41-1054(+)
MPPHSQHNSGISGRHWIVKWIAVFLIVTGLLLTSLNQKSTSILEFEGMSSMGGDFSVQDFKGGWKGETYQPNLRVYTPYSPVGSTLKPIHLFIHGGGWVRGSLDSYDHLTSALAYLLKTHIVVSVEYRLAPNTKFPGAVSDCLKALDWIIDRAVHFGGDVRKISVHGDSAGGNLAIALTIQAIRNKIEDESILGAEFEGPFCAAVYTYPVTDYSMSTKSYEEFENGPGLTKANMKSFWEAYLEYPEMNKYDVLAAPDIATKEEVKYFPPSFVALAESDLLRDEGMNFASKLEEAGVDASLKVYPDTVHGFLSHGAADGDLSNPIFEDITKFIKSKCD